MFSFTGKDGKTLTINEVDAMAAAFWGKEVHPRHYASPFSIGCAANWFDFLGHAIEDCQYVGHQVNKSKDPFGLDSIEWHYVAAQLARMNATHCHTYEELIESVQNIKPFIELIYHLEEHGVVAHPQGW